MEKIEAIYVIDFKYKYAKCFLGGRPNFSFGAGLIFCGLVTLLIAANYGSQFSCFLTITDRFVGS